MGVVGVVVEEQQREEPSGAYHGRRSAVVRCQRCSANERSSVSAPPTHATPATYTHRARPEAMHGGEDEGGGGEVAGESPGLGLASGRRRSAATTGRRRPAVRAPTDRRGSHRRRSARTGPAPRPRRRRRRSSPGRCRGRSAVGEVMGEVDRGRCRTARRGRAGPRRARFTACHGVGCPWTTSCCSELYQAPSTARAMSTTGVGTVVPQQHGGEPGVDRDGHGHRRPLNPCRPLMDRLWHRGRSLRSTNSVNFVVHATYVG